MKIPFAGARNFLSKKSNGVIGRIQTLPREIVYFYDCEPWAGCDILIVVLFSHTASWSCLTNNKNAFGRNFGDLCWFWNSKNSLSSDLTSHCLTDWAGLDWEEEMTAIKYWGLFGVMKDVDTGSHYTKHKPYCVRVVTLYCTGRLLYARN